VREKIRAKSLYQLFEVIQFLKLFNRIVRGQFSLVGQTLQVIALGQKHTSPHRQRRTATPSTRRGATQPTHGAKRGEKES
jgi:hypothetical protein